MNEGTPPARSSSRTALVLALTGFYFVAGKIGLALAIVHPQASAVWPPTGIALAALFDGGASALARRFAGRVSGQPYRARAGGGGRSWRRRESL